MKRGFKWAAVALAVLVAPIVGCVSNGTPRQNFAAGQDTFIAAVQTLQTARESGLIPDGTWENLKFAISDANQVLDEWDEQSLNGEGEIEAAQFRAIMRSLQPFVLEYERQLMERDH